MSSSIVSLADAQVGAWMPSSPGTGTLGPSTLTRVSGKDERHSPPTWVAAVPALEALDEPAADTPPPPLFDRVRRRGILSSALATCVDEGDLDMQRIMACASEGKPLAHLPRLPVPTLRQGVQVLLDVGEGMDPFAEDQRGLVLALDDVLADVRLEVLRFVGCPSRGVCGPSGSRYRAWQFPPRGVPMLVVTDLGVGGPTLDPARGTSAEWAAFAHRLRQAQHVLVGLVPYEATRWPMRLARSMTLIHWSERTTVGAVRRALRDVRRRLDR